MSPARIVRERGQIRTDPVAVDSVFGRTPRSRHGHGISNRRKSGHDLCIYKEDPTGNSSTVHRSRISTGVVSIDGVDGPVGPPQSTSTPTTSESLSNTASCSAVSDNMPPGGHDKVVGLSSCLAGGDPIPPLIAVRTVFTDASLVGLGWCFKDANGEKNGNFRIIT